ncbi:NAD(P)-dependent alcohol dehydrogenase [Bacillus sp. FJAT-49732]|uniref:NAD(P)-dependent alcohol dehydrogenase n=1 Tax=Lederbergia citrisecunda TaxID=2833583 RepID=A0A942TPL1_9BACI|nr:NAD(P)-dependent alcohol dehydrogenase [Lederbergia citrisecunda]MBS4201208.1 NAD(P)-dependent alcohol dehydrogenase [Lederbergia citrisecunda]
MRAIVYTKYGSTDVLKLEEVERPSPKDNEILIKVHAVSINSWDWDLLRGKPFMNRIGGLLKPKYNILGADIAGQVVAIGKDVKEFLPGDEVFGDISGCGWGGFAEYVCVRESALTLKPASMSFEEAAAIPQAAVLALQGLRVKGKIQVGEKVLINGAGGGVGTFALQIAKLFGAEVTGVDSTKKMDMLRSIGADQVIDYTQEDFTQKGQRYDLILDVVGSRSISDYKRALNPKGTYAMIGGPTNRILQLLLLRPLISLTGKNMSLLIHKPNQNDQNIIKKFFEAGNVVPIIDRCYPLSEAAQALRYFGEGHAKGKVVISIEHENTVLEKGEGNL